MFGSSSRGPNPASAQPVAGDIYDQQQKPAPAAASPFGSGSIDFGAAATPNLFGSTSTPNPFGAKLAFGSPSTPTPAFGQSSTPAFMTRTFGLSGSAFGGASAPVSGAASAPAYSQANSTPASGSSPSPFGQSSGAAFGSSTFGASSPSLFGQSSPAFGAASTPAFGVGASAPAFGGQTSSAFGGVGLFGNTQAASSGEGLFGSSTPGSQPFGASPAPPFGLTLFGNTSTPGPMFGQTKPAGLTLSSSPSLFNGFGPTPGGQPPSAVSFPNLQTAQQGTNSIFGPAPSSFGEQNACGLQHPTQNVISVPSTLVTNPFGTLPAKPQITIGLGRGSGPSVQHGISSMPVRAFHHQACVDVSITNRPCDPSQVTFFRDDDDTPSTPKSDVMSIPSSSYGQCPASSCSHPSYSYKPLDIGQIRLIELEAPRESEPLRGKITHRSLSAELHYSALSYCWGTSPERRTIILDGMKLQITVNLHDALRQLGNSCGRLWVDAICINQEDIPEKSREVLKMGEIYSLASGVVAWLGVGDETSDKAMAFLKVLATKYPRPEYDEYLEALPSSEDSLGKFGNEWIALMDLVKNGYWSRTWIIQELALCRRSKMVHCGTKSLPWENFVNVFSETFATCVMVGTPDEEVFGEVSSGLDNLMALSFFERCLRLGGTYSKGVFHLLSVTERFQASDPRDYVYGMLALSMDLRKMVPHPNYASSKEVVFRDLTKAMLGSGYNLDLICYKHPTHVNQPDVISWVPRWDVRGIWFPSPEFLLHALKHNRGRGVYSADAGRDALISYVGDGSILRVRGYLYDEIDGLGSTGLAGSPFKTRDTIEPDHNENAYGSAVDTFRALKELSEETFRVFNPEDARGGYSLNNEFLSLRVGLQLRFMDPNSSTTKIAVQWLQQLKEFSFVGRGLLDWYKDAYKHEQALPSPSRDPDLDGMLDCLTKVVGDGWKWLCTERGYLGRTHPQTRKGDQIVIVQGCAVPMVLRPCGPHYSVVGAAYVQGIMHGEALQGVRDDEMGYFDLA